MALPQKHTWTPAEYLAFERESDTRHEYLDGQIYDMAGASDNHERIVGSTSATLYAQTRKRDCIVYGGNMRVKAADSGLYAHPDLSVVCGKPRFEEMVHPDTLLNPIVLVEILPPSTEQYDRGEKFQRYRAINSLQTYVLIAQDKPLIEVYTRQTDGGWLLADYKGLEAVISPTLIDCQLALADVYEKVDFASSSEAS